jgi:hypothetical protein
MNTGSAPATVALFERDYAEPLGFQLEYALKLKHWSLPYPDITT